MTDIDYFARRCIEERAAAQAAADPRIASIHEDMAVLYEAAAKLAEPLQQPVSEVLQLRVG